jgi:hypothetical protein
MTSERERPCVEVFFGVGKSLSDTVELVNERCSSVLMSTALPYYVLEILVVPRGAKGASGRLRWREAR